MQLRWNHAIRFRRWALPAALVLVAGSLVFTAIRHQPLAAAASPPAPPTHDTILTVQGTATTMVTPTSAVIQMGTQVHAKTAKSAMDQSSAAMHRVIQKVEGDGIPAQDLQTGQINLYPQTPPGHPDQISSYQVTQTLRITVDALDQVGTVIDDAVAAGANTMEGITFLPPDPHQWRQQAYQQALADARAQAEALAADAKEHIVAVASIDTVNASGGGPMPFSSKVMAAPSVPVLPGQQTEQVTVTVRYRLAPNA